MTKVNKLLLAFLLLSNLLLAQNNEIRPAAIGISLINNDYLTAHRIRSTSLSTVVANNQWARFPEMDKGIALHYFKGLHKHIDFNSSLYALKTTDAMGIGKYSNKSFLAGMEAAANFKLVSEKYWIQPYLITGIGAQMFDTKYFGAYLYPGLGMKANFNDNIHLFVTGQYNIPVTPATVAHHFNRQIGLAIRVGKKQVAPAAPLPPVAIMPAADTDGDGIIDTEDACPTQPGPKALNGCPDRDGDGIADKDDGCPDAAGSAALFGCPDTDGDGVPDRDDKCPALAGPPSNQGCPEVKESVKKTIEDATKAIYFVTNGHALEKRSLPALNKIEEVLKNDPDLKADISGHTDNVGKPEYNLALSERRAQVVHDWLVQNGIDAARLTSTGYGLTKPVADNRTPGGRQLNRRTEMHLHYD